MRSTLNRYKLRLVKNFLADAFYSHEISIEDFEFLLAKAERTFGP